VHDEDAPTQDPIEVIAEILVRFGGGDLDARAERADDGSPVDKLAFAVNLTMDELAARFEESARQVVELQARGEQLEQSNKALVEAQQRLGHLGKLAALGELSALLTRQLGHPLSVVETFTSVLEEDAWGLNADQWTSVQEIRQGVDRMRAIVENLDRFSGHESFAGAPTPAREALDAALALFEHDFDGHGIDCVVQAADRLPDVTIPPAMAQQVFINLLSNARDALVGLQEREPRTIRITVAAEGDSVTYRFHDSGPGIPENLAARVFRPFFTTKAEGSGTGLGLALSRDIIERQGGAMELVRGEAGACFVVEVPAVGQRGSR